MLSSKESICVSKDFDELLWRSCKYFVASASGSSTCLEAKGQHQNMILGFQENKTKISMILS
jgi:hypothetical protein